MIKDDREWDETWEGDMQLRATGQIWILWRSGEDNPQSNQSTLVAVATKLKSI